MADCRCYVADLVPSSKTWPQDARPDYIIRDQKRLAMLDENARGENHSALISLHLLVEHYAALAAMKQLKTVLDNYVDGVKP